MLRKVSKKLLLVLLTLALLTVSIVGGYAWSWQGYEDTALDTQYKEDGFVFGVRYSQVGDAANKGHSLAGNAVFADKAEAAFDPAVVEKDFYNMNALGLNAVAINLFTLMEGVQFDQQGQITGLDEAFTTNLDATLGAAKANGLKVAVTLQPALNELATGLVGSGKAVWDQYTQMYYSEAVRAQYVDLCVKPVLDVLKKYEDEILYIAIVSQPEKDIAAVQGGFGTTWDKMVAFVDAVNAVCRETLPGVSTTVETDAAYVANFNTVELTAAGVNAYVNNGADLTAPADVTSTFPLYLSRFGILKGSEATEDFHTQTNRDILNTAISSGYLGAFFDEWNGKTATRSMFVDGTLRRFATTLFFTAFNYREDRAGTFNDSPAVMLYNENNGKVQWIGSAIASTYTVERSVDGKEWTAVSEDMAANDVDNGYFLCTWTDNDRAEDTTYQYRIVMDKGTDYESVSAPSN